jgi:hypothetical protein
MVAPVSVSRGPRARVQSDEDDKPGPSLGHFRRCDVVAGSGLRHDSRQGPDRAGNKRVSVTSENRVLATSVAGVDSRLVESCKYCYLQKFFRQNREVNIPGHPP